VEILVGTVANIEYVKGAYRKSMDKKDLISPIKNIKSQQKFIQQITSTQNFPFQ
jgi:hypothetical protein